MALNCLPVKAVPTNIKSSLASISAIDIFDSIGNVTLRLINVYRPPALLLTDSRGLLCELFALSAVSYPVTIVGDFNFCNIDWSIPTGTFTPDLEFLEFLSQCSFTQLVSEPTRHSRILDLVLANAQIVSDVVVGNPFANSDHRCVTFSVLSEAFSPEPIMFLDFKRCDSRSIEHFLYNIDWHSLSRDHSELDDFYECFVDIVRSLIHKFVPFSYSNAVEDYPLHIQKLFSYRENLFSHHISERIRNKIAIVNKSINREIAKFRRNQINKYFSKGCSKRFYSYISKFTKSGVHVPPLFYESKNYFSDGAKANCLGQYFKSVYVLNHTPLLKQSPPADILNDTPLLFPYQVFDILSHCKLSNNTSPDSIPFIFLNKFALTLSLPVSLIFNRSFVSGTVPSLWCQAIVLPLHKKGSKDCPSNYRPISLTCSLARICEKVVRKHILSFLNRKNIISESQHGFCRRKSIETNLLEYLDDVTASLDCGKCTDSIYLDFAKAFDTVPHNVLLDKLVRIGISGSVLSWISSFLSNRSFRVKINSSFSDSFPVTSGVPQGSVLGPTLFLLFINDLPDFCKTDDVTIKLFADDLKIYCPIVRPTHSNLQTCLNKLYDWCSLNALYLSPGKSSVLHLGLANPRAVYLYDNSPIPVAESSVRDLGVLIDPLLKFDCHISSIVSRARQRLFLLLKAVKSRNPVLLKRLFVIYVRPILEFASIVFSPHLKCQIEKLESVQRLATRIILSRSHFGVKLSYEERLLNLNLETLVSRRKKADVLFYRKCLLRKTILNCTSKPRFVPHPRKTDITLFHIPRGRKTVRRNFFLLRAPTSFSKIPQSALKSTRVFKDYIDKNF
jgi:hypothetical protein